MKKFIFGLAFLPCVAIAQDDGFKIINYPIHMPIEKRYDNDKVDCGYSQEGLVAQLPAKDKNYVYQEVCHWVTSNEIYKVNVKTKKRISIGDANGMLKIIGGKYDGNLIISRHIYLPAPDYGTRNPYLVISPNGKVILEIKDSEENEKALDNWLKANHAKAY